MITAKIEIKNLDYLIQLLEQFKNLVKEINELDVEVNVTKVEPHMSTEKAKEILAKQLELLSECSKKCPYDPNDLANITHAMIEIVKTLDTWLI